MSRQCAVTNQTMTPTQKGGANGWREIESRTRPRASACVARVNPQKGQRRRVTSLNGQIVGPRSTGMATANRAYAPKTVTSARCDDAAGCGEPRPDAKAHVSAATMLSPLARRGDIDQESRKAEVAKDKTARGKTSAGQPAPRVPDLTVRYMSEDYGGDGPEPKDPEDAENK